MESSTSGKRIFSVLSSSQLPTIKSFHKRYGSYNLLPAISKEVGINNYIEGLKTQITEKEEKIVQLSKILQSPLTSRPPNNPLPSVSCYLSPEQRVFNGQELLKDLDNQVESKARVRLQASLDKEKDLKETLEHLKSQRLEQMRQKLISDQRSEDYRKQLLIQQQIKNQLNEALLIDQALLQPLVHYRNYKTNSTDRVQYAPKLNSDELLPIRKNLNPLPAHYSNLPAFKQPLYTKHHPKLQTSYPIIGSNPF